jgi:hypothetical protein
LWYLDIMQKRERWAALAGAIMISLFVPTAIDQEYFRYNPYLLPVLGLIAILLYTGFFISSNIFIKLVRSFYAKSGKVSIVTMLIVIAAIGTILFKAERYAISKSKEHIATLKTKDTLPALPQPTPPKLIQPKQPTTTSIKDPTTKKQVTPQKVTDLKELPPSPKPPVAKKQGIPEVEKYLPVMGGMGIGTLSISGSNPPVKICRDHPYDEFVRQGRFRPRISVSEVNKDNNGVVVSGKLCMVDDEQERNPEKFTSVSVNTCMMYDNYSIRVISIANGFNCAEFAVSYNEKPCR